MRYPSHYLNTTAFVESIARTVVQFEIDFVMASHNETEILARYRHLLPHGSDRAIPQAAHCELLNNKARAYEFAQSLGITVPRRISYRDPSDVQRIFRELDRGKGVVIKLLTGNSAKGVHYAANATEASQIVDCLIQRFRLGVDRFPQIEERVEGFGAGCSILAWNGERIAGFCHRRLREKISTGGTSTLRESMRHPEMESAAWTILGSLGWHGLAMVEFKICPKSGKPWFIEVNPRMWGSMALAIDAGVEFPYLLWLCATRGPDAARAYVRTHPARVPWRGRWLLGDLITGASSLARGDVVAAMDAMFRGGADSCDDLRWDDPVAFAGECVHYVTKFAVARSTNPSEEGMIG